MGLECEAAMAMFCLNHIYFRRGWSNPWATFPIRIRMMASHVTGTATGPIEKLGSADGEALADFW